MSGDEHIIGKVFWYVTLAITGAAIMTGAWRALSDSKLTPTERDMAWCEEAKSFHTLQTMPFRCVELLSLPRCNCDQ
jgi:hypothetical protein